MIVPLFRRWHITNKSSFFVLFCFAFSSSFQINYILSFEEVTLKFISVGEQVNSGPFVFSALWSC